MSSNTQNTILWQKKIWYRNTGCCGTWSHPARCHPACISRCSDPQSCAPTDNWKLLLINEMRSGTWMDTRVSEGGVWSGCALYSPSGNSQAGRGPVTEEFSASGSRWTPSVMAPHWGTKFPLDQSDHYLINSVTTEPGLYLSSTAVLHIHTHVSHLCSTLVWIVIDQSVDNHTSCLMEINNVLTVEALNIVFCTIFLKTFYRVLVIVPLFKYWIQFTCSVKNTRILHLSHFTGSVGQCSSCCIKVHRIHIYTLIVLQYTGHV